MKLFISNDNGQSLTKVTEWTDFYYQCDVCGQLEHVDYDFFAKLIEELDDAATITCPNCVEKQSHDTSPTLKERETNKEQRKPDRRTNEEILYKQFTLLAEVSKSAVSQDLPALTDAMLNLYAALPKKKEW